jgi:hypothetical protein
MQPVRVQLWQSTVVTWNVEDFQGEKLAHMEQTIRALNLDSARGGAPRTADVAAPQCRRARLEMCVVSLPQPFGCELAGSDTQLDPRAKRVA